MTGLHDQINAFMQMMQMNNLCPQQRQAHRVLQNVVLDEKVGFSKGSTSSNSMKGKEKVVEPQLPKRYHDIKCFKFLGHGHINSKCLNKRVMVVHRKHGELVINNEAKTKVKDEIGEDKQGEDFELGEEDFLVEQWVLNAKVDLQIFGEEQFRLIALNPEGVWRLFS
ncbi:hypothetical protein SADUNF_Sadunf19G0061400 [Salix dunnii]|uniref:Uncharacterized protein n=1 Tax=Salix dunnii TaxID=1413687 RepID=A0A835IYN2_9ROSI|nr:hypothetical protein SADUNF_Sadunf19G0061400 [Salix dunnii]